jgi:prepilin-type N-terminal cleavage/methylation domain-containing protein
MELNMKTKRSSQRGMSLIELMIASFVLITGVLGCAVLIPIAIGTNGKNRQQSNSTVIAQMTMEKIMSSAAAGSSALTLTDCAGTSNTINVTGTTAGSGATLLSSGSREAPERRRVITCPTCRAAQMAGSPPTTFAGTFRRRRTTSSWLRFQRK